jgi:enoyl-CoA hydratase/carnithine racemase
MVLTGRRLSADEALRFGIVSRVVPNDELDATARQMAEAIVAAPAIAVNLARRVIGRLARPQQRSSMGDESTYQTLLNRSADFAEFRAARIEGRPPRYTGN